MNSHIERHLRRVKSKQAESSYETHRTNLKDFNKWLNSREQTLTELSPLDLEIGAMLEGDSGRGTKKLALYDDFVWPDPLPFPRR